MGFRRDAVPVWFATPVIGVLLIVATVTDLRRREVPGWLTVGAIGTGLLVAAAAGPDVLLMSALGLVVGGLLLLPFVIRGGFGAADALLLAALGAWQGWQFVLWTAWWAALAGAGLAVVAWRRGQRTFPYVPAIASGAAMALLSM
jgi:prepilin peptidase CpaA